MRARSLPETPLLWHLHGCDALSDEDLGQLDAFLASRSQDLQPSRVFDGEASVLSSSRRSSECELADPYIFDVCVRVLRQLCPEVFHLLRLVRGHADLVESSPGDFFKSHTDFPLVTTPVGHVSLTLLVCVEPAKLGGELLLYAGVPGEEKVCCYSRGSATLFPCALPHAGLEVQRGRKTLLKYDVISTEPLWKLEAERPETGTYEDRILRIGTFSRLDSLVAKALFDGDSGCTRTSLVNADEIRLLANFFDGVASAGDLSEVLLLLDRLCCPEAQLSSSELLQLITRSAAVLPSRVLTAPFLHSPLMYSVLFVACAHRRSGVSIEKASEEMLQSYCSAAPYGLLMFARAGADYSNWFLDCDFLQSAEAAKRVVLEHAIKTIELYDEVLVSTHYYSDDVSNEFSGDEDSAGAVAEWSLTAPDVGITQEEMQALGERAVEAICDAQPASRVVSARSEINECNDGSTYREVQYQTTVLRSGYVLLKVS